MGGQVSVEVDSAPDIDLAKMLSYMRSQYEVIGGENSSVHKFCSTLVTHCKFHVSSQEAEGESPH